MSTRRWYICRICRVSRASSHIFVFLQFPREINISSKQYQNQSVSLTTSMNPKATELIFWSFRNMFPCICCSLSAFRPTSMCWICRRTEDAHYSAPNAFTAVLGPDNHNGNHWIDRLNQNLASTSQFCKNFSGNWGERVRVSSSGAILSMVCSLFLLLFTLDTALAFDLLAMFTETSY